MTTLQQTGPNRKPEDLYRQTTDKHARRRLQAEVIEACRGRVAAYARKQAPIQFLEEAAQVGLIGVLVALEEYEPALCCKVGGDRGAAFWNFAFPFVRNELQTWMDRAVYWRPRPRKARDATKQRHAHAYPASMDAPSGEEIGQTLHDQIAAEALAVDDAAAESEAAGRLHSFAASLESNERKTLFSEHGQCVRSRRYLSLVGRATVAVKGEESDQPITTVGRRTLSSRP